MRNCLGCIFGCVNLDFEVIKLLCKRNGVNNIMLINAQKDADAFFGCRECDIKACLMLG